MLFGDVDLLNACICAFNVLHTVSNSIIVALLYREIDYKFHVVVCEM